MELEISVTFGKISLELFPEDTEKWKTYFQTPTDILVFSVSNPLSPEFDYQIPCKTSFHIPTSFLEELVTELQYFRSKDVSHLGINIRRIGKEDESSDLHILFLRNNISSEFAILYENQVGRLIEYLKGFSGAEEES